MRKSNLLLLTLMLILASSTYAQDKAYLDFDRTGWKAKAPAYSPVDTQDGFSEKVTAEAKFLLDDNQGTFFSVVKPGKTYDGVAGPDKIQQLGFTIEMTEAKIFDYFQVYFRKNKYDYLRPWKISLYGSNDATADFTSGEWTSIRTASNDSIITLPNAEGSGNISELFETGYVELNNTVAYKYIKVIYEGMSESTSGSTMQMAEFFVGKTTFDKVIMNPGNVTFGDVEAASSLSKTLAITGYNLNNTISYTVQGDGASAFTAVQKTPGTPSSTTSDTIVITFSPTEKKLYEATLLLDMDGVLESQTINLTGNADFDLPAQLDNWYFIQFERQATNGTVLTKVGSNVEQTVMNVTNNDQMWKVSGTWENYTITNKAGEQLVYLPGGEEDDAGNPVPPGYGLSAAGDTFGFVRYQTTDTWQLKNNSTLFTDSKIYLNDGNGATTVSTEALNNAGNQLRFISADAKAFVYAADTIAIGAVARLESGTLTVNVAGLNLTETITVTLSNDEDNVYTLNTASLPVTGGVIELVFAPKAYRTVSYATITLKSGELEESFVVSATSDAGKRKYYVGNWTYTPEDGEIAANVPTTLQAGDEMWIAAGEYTVPEIKLLANTAIYGGFAGTETSVDARVKTADGKAWEFENISVLKNNAGIIFTIGGASTIIDGITFQGTEKTGRAIQNSSATIEGGIIRNCIFKNFNSSADGGAMNIRSKSEIYNCLITGNKGNKGGGAYLDLVTIHDCEIVGNSVPTTAETSIGNINGGGGGLLLVACEAYNLYVAENTASYGGGLFPRTTTKVYNSIIVDNTASQSGGGISFDERDSGTLIYNVTIANNNSNLQGGTGGVNFAANATGKSAKLYNSIIWNNTDIKGEIYNIGLSSSLENTYAEPEIKNVIIDDTDFYAADIHENLAIINGIAEDDSTKLFAENWITAVTCPGINKGFTLLTDEEKDPDTGDILIPATYLEFATGKDYAGNERIFDTIDIGPFENQTFSAITRPNADLEGNVISTKYYNLQGMEVSVPVGNNVYIKAELLDTNKIRTTKVLFTGKYINQ